MKFSKKGRKKMGEFLCGFHRCVVSPYAKVITPLNFEPSDFEDCVVLTTEEAKVIFEIVEEARDFLWKIHRVPLAEESQKKVDDLRKRIEQAEKENASN